MVVCLRLFGTIILGHDNCDIVFSAVVSSSIFSSFAQQKMQYLSAVLLNLAEIATSVEGVWLITTTDHNETTTEHNWPQLTTTRPQLTTTDHNGAQRGHNEATTWPQLTTTDPQLKANLVHFSLKIWHLIAPILLLFLLINWQQCRINEHTGQFLFYFA